MTIEFIEVSADNVDEHGLCCVVNRKSTGFKSKLEWLKDITNSGLGIIIAINPDTQKQLGFIEFTDSELAWRPVNATDQLFIHCIAVFSKKDRNLGIAGMLIHQAEIIAVKRKKLGLCTFTSNGAWMAGKALFENNDFEMIEAAGRFELMWKKLDDQCKPPRINDWKKESEKYQGWNIVYADQCPWHFKSVSDIGEYAKSIGLDLKVRKIASPIEAQNGPSGYGTFALIKDGVLLEDHYISKTRFINIIKKNPE